MLNDRDDKYENPEESEYHFSDEEVNYEVETESPKGVPVSGQKESVLNRLTRSKRMLITLGVFLVLVFVVYKMVAPSSSTQSTDIATPVVAQAQSRPMTSVTQATTQQAPVLPVATTASNNMPPSVATTTTTSQMPSQAPVQTQTTTQTAPSQPVSLPQMQVSQVALPVQAPPQIQTQTSTSTIAAPTQQAAATPSMTETTTTVTQPSAVTGMGTVLSANTDSRVAALASENQKLANELQQEYAQKVNDYASQNKALQDQVQTLNTRVASMETQMNQLVQALTRQNQVQNAAVQQQPTQQQDHSADVKVPYSVQAIIPGRAWLRSDNGETVTVAEGDLVKDVGRVTKIDPYDGIVEINTGTKSVSLSYGNGS